MRLVLDTNVVVSALLWGGAPNRLFRAAFGEDIQLFTSEILMEELKGILRLRKFARKIQASGLSAEHLADLYRRGTVLVIPMPVPRLVSDPDDDVVIGTALAAKADFIVTGDHALLAVGEYQGVGIVSVGEVLRAANL